MPTPYHLAASPSFYLVHRFAFLASLSDIHSHSLQDCKVKEALPRSETMAETTPLLPRANRPPHDPSIVLRICHSPWLFISQKLPLAVRAIIASFLSFVLTLDIIYAINHTHRGRQFALEASNVSLVIQNLYYWITTVCISPLRCISPSISPAVLDTAAYFGTLWSDASRGTNQERTPSPDISRALNPKAH